MTVGRTHMMDAAPMFMGQQFGGWAAQLASTRPLLDAAIVQLTQVPLGGTAVGTGLNVPAGWVDDALGSLRSRTGLDVRVAVDRFAAQGGGEAYLEASAAMRGVAVAATKVASDLRLLASGPHTGIAELHLPELQAGSSIMPGKVNPVIPESVLQVAARVVGNDATIVVAASGGVLQLNTFQPLVADVLSESAALLARGVVRAGREVRPRDRGRHGAQPQPCSRVAGVDHGPLRSHRLRPGDGAGEAGGARRSPPG